MRKTKRGQWCGLTLGTIAFLSNPALGRSIATTIGAIAHLTPTCAQAATLNQWQFNPETRELLITLPSGTTPRYFLMAQPPRIILELPDTQLGAIVEQENYAGAVRRIRVAQFQPDVARIVIELAPNVEFAPGQVELRVLDETNDQANRRWVLRPLLADVSTDPTAPIATSQPPAEDAQAGVSQVEASPVETSDVADAPATAIAPGTTSPSLETPTPDTDPTEAAPTAPTLGLPTVPLTPVSPPAPPSLEQIQADQPETASPDDPIEPEVDSPAEVANDAEVEAIAIPIQAPTTTSTGEHPTVETAPLPASTPVNETPSLSVAPAAETIAPLALPTTLPPASFNTDRSATISVPPLISTESAPGPSPLLPPARPADVPTTRVTVPPPRLPARLSEAEAITPTAPFARSLGTPLTAATPITPATPPAPTSTAPTPESPAEPPPISFAPSTTSPVSYSGYVVEFGNPLPTQAPAESNPADEEVVFSIEDPASGQSALITDALPPEEPDSVEQTSPTENLDSVDNDPPAEFIAIATSTPASENQPADASVLLPSGTVLNLRYPGLDPLELQDGPPWQEVLLVDQPIYDHTGEVLIPAGSEVIGRFEISSRGSRFIAQAITLNGQNIRLAGSSERQSSVIQPDQIVEVRLTAAISRQN